MSTVTLEYAKSGEPGVAKRIKKEGVGPKPTMGQVVSVDFSIFLESGSELLAGKKREVCLGRREIWGTGFDLAVVSMRPGEHALVTCSEEFAGPTDGHPQTTMELHLHAVVADMHGVTPSEKRVMMAAAIFFVVGVLAFLWKEGFLR